MASYRYTREIRPEDLRPEPQHQMTPAEKRKNFWYYNKWKILIALAAAVLAGVTVWQAATQVQPDYQVGLLSTQAVPSQVSMALQEALQTVADDRNGDGQVVVAVMPYEPLSETPEVVMAATAHLMGDAEMGANAFLLCDDPSAFPDLVTLFADNSGTPLEPGDTGSLAAVGTPLGEYPALAGALDGWLAAQQDDTGAAAWSVDFLQQFLVVRCARLSDADEEQTAYFAASDAWLERLRVEEASP